MNQTVRQIDPAVEGRQQARTHFLVAATLYTDAGPTPVTIRNMSHSGALIEAAALPDVGERVRLKRGLLTATGRIAWRIGRKAGLRLEAAIHVADWMSRQVSAAQEEVDSLIAIVRTNGTPAAARSTEPPAGMSIEAELVQLGLELGALEAALLKDIILVATHPEIQTFDISLQRIDRVLKRLRAGG